MRSFLKTSHIPDHESVSCRECRSFCVDCHSSSKRHCVQCPAEENINDLGCLILDIYRNTAIRFKRWHFFNNFILFFDSRRIDLISSFIDLHFHFRKNVLCSHHRFSILSNKRKPCGLLKVKQEVPQGLCFLLQDRILRQLLDLLLQVLQSIRLLTFLKLVFLLLLVFYLRQLVEDLQDLLFQDLLDLVNSLQNLRQVMLFHHFPCHRSDFYFLRQNQRFLSLQIILLNQCLILLMIHSIFFYKQTLRHQVQFPFR